MLLVVGGSVALAATGPVSLLEAADLLGIAGFLPPSGDRRGAVTADPWVLRRALLALLVGVATALVILAICREAGQPDPARVRLRPAHPPRTSAGCRACAAPAPRVPATA
ncbi:hypothetical protein ACFO1B_00395 [Dactylosporangium siamense]|uniref:Uncharacterized protein n=1 Tax=Dactylosporangium siamense TaxID=685454 RepID=A0A919U912_9ACTN|nr:hypothetical protein [Dactylosporangium siamense]GIG42193.1 hypothetical protein Dsi01nite_002340 [Dactylosporangium siamense]